MAAKFDHFGTDGIRGRVGEHPITNDFVLKLGWAIGRTLMIEGGQSKPVVLIGKDTRISGYMLESALQAGLVSSGCDIRLCGPLATPGVAYLTRTFRADAGIVISASHNPYTDNGIKIFNANGIKIDDATQQQIETNLKQEMTCVPADALGKATRINDAVGRYVEFCKSAFAKKLSLKGLRIVLDCANGATYNSAPMVFTELGAEVIQLGDDPDGFNINENCGSTAPERAVEMVRTYRANLGIAIDGDGDRVTMIDDQGKLLDGDDLLYILIWSMHHQNTLKGTVGTHMTNTAIEEFCTKEGIQFSRVDVGDRNIISKLHKHGWNLGGEPSGHIICADFATTGDAIISSLMILAALQHHRTTLHQARRAFSPRPQVHRKIPFHTQQRNKANGIITRYTEQVNQELAGKGRALVRVSGTEPVIRVMVEAIEEDLAKSVCERITAQIQQTLRN